MKTYYERDTKGTYTGVTICDIDGVKGYSFCYPDKANRYDILNDKGDVVDIAYSTRKGDQFCRKTGRLIAEGRAKKTRKLLQEGTNHDSILEKVYSPRMIRKIQEFAGRHPENY